ncbi:hypothetical protein GCK72_004476 [Caenorhabditis remanei]|uniref:Uncharacterized protein n=1 Tax=Caenorhabditis remanei TaxID=31234 RepID=A0A6A5H9V5_CAERE|nr:hypothetical protein GCK72_004476 [Caenorhabditis remanei]KAF1764528.1 hypothetical protein GCK72_004476 [Caenorhabditis remanei]
MEDYAENAFTPIPASMEYIRQLRTATMFRVYVVYIDVLSLVALVLSVFTFVLCSSLAAEKNRLKATPLWLSPVKVREWLAKPETIRQLNTKQVFSRSITHLLIASLIYGNFHNLSYTIIETWSLYRSFVYSNDMSKIMFTSEECFFQHVINSCVRFLFIAIELALNFDRAIVPDRHQPDTPPSCRPARHRLRQGEQRN